MRTAPVRLLSVAIVAAVSLLALSSPALAADAFPPTPQVPCEAGSLTESTQGRVPLSEVTSGRAAKGYTCNAPEVGHSGVTGGFRDPAKPREIAYFNGKVKPDSNPLHQGAFAMAAPAFSPRADEYWYSDGNLGFYAVKTTAAARRSAALDKPPVPPKKPVVAPRPPASCWVGRATWAVSFGVSPHSGCQWGVDSRFAERGASAGSPALWGTRRRAPARTRSVGPSRHPPRCGQQGPRSRRA